jgi:hypothetical protein
MPLIAPHVTLTQTSETMASGEITWSAATMGDIGEDTRIIIYRGDEDHDRVGAPLAELSSLSTGFSFSSIDIGTSPVLILVFVNSAGETSMVLPIVSEVSSSSSENESGGSKGTFIAWVVPAAVVLVVLIVIAAVLYRRESRQSVESRLFDLDNNAGVIFQNPMYRLQQQDLEPGLEFDEPTQYTDRPSAQGVDALKME